MSFIDTPLYTYTAPEAFEYSVHAIKGNRECKLEKKTFNLCRASLNGKLVNPQECLAPALDLINCFQKVRQNKVRPGDAEKFTNAVNCGSDSFGKSSFGGCSKEINEYLNN
mmetsp:Transcript_117449/g.165165  ORF Transcript_117449/g.165165 Transcript_117449/m.165165 type:complete len:111 (+) Transcript_117449:63-395(+)